MATQFWVKRPGGKKGPFSAAQIKQLLKAGKLTTNDEISQDGNKWHRIGLVLQNLRKRKTDVIEDYEVVDEIADVDDFMEDFEDDIEDYGDDPYGQFGPPASVPPVWGGTANSKSKVRSEGSWSGASAALSIFYYSYLLTAVVVIIFSSTMMALVPPVVAGILFRLEILDRTSRTGAFIVGDVFLVFACLGFLGLMSSARGGTAPWWSLLAVGYSMILGVLLNPAFLDTGKEVLQTAVPFLLRVAQWSYLLSGVAQMVAWFMSLSVPAQSGLRKYIVIGLICLLFPTILIVYREFGGMTNLLLQASLGLAVVISIIGAFVTFALYLRGIGRHFKQRSLVESVDEYVAKTLITIGLCFGCFVLFILIPRDVGQIIAPVFAIVMLYMGPYLVVLLVDAVDRARDAVS